MNNISRRTFLRTTTVATAGLTLMPNAFSSPESHRIYVGTYTGSDGHGEGIYLFDYNPATGALANRKLAATTTSPSWIALHPSKRFLYAVNEGGHSGAVTSFAIEADGALRQLNSVSSRGSAPCYLSFDPAGKYAFVANYMSGSLAVFPIAADGKLGEASDVVTHTGVTGAPHGATTGPRGSYDIIGHDAPHAHFIHFDVAGRFALAADLGQDRIYTYKFDAAAGKLIQQSTVSIPNGDGPRHLAFHPNGKWVYLITEQGSTITFFHYNPENGTLQSQQILSTLPEGFAGTSFGSEITLHPNGKWIYASNRLHDSVAVYTIGPDGRLTHTSQAHTQGDYPRHQNIAPDGHYFFICNQKGDNIPTLRINQQTGALEPTGHYAAAGTPACIIFA